LGRLRRLWKDCYARSGMKIIAVIATLFFERKNKWEASETDAEIE
jgi:hypothetical protein